MIEYNLSTLDDADLRMLRSACKHKERAQKFYGWLESGLRREHTRRLLIETNQPAGSPVLMKLPSLGVLDLREALAEVSRIGQSFLAIAKKDDDGHFADAAKMFGQMTVQLLAQIQAASSQN